MAKTLITSINIPNFTMHFLFSIPKAPPKERGMQGRNFSGETEAECLTNFRKQYKTAQLKCMYPIDYHQLAK